MTYFVTSLTMSARKVAICVTFGKWCKRSPQTLWHQLELVSRELHS